MFFLLRTAFWLSLLLLVLPIGGGARTDGPSEKDRASIDTMSALAAAGATVSDVGGFCERQPDACKVGTQALQLMSERAKNGAAMLHDYLGSDKAGARDKADPKLLTTGAAAPGSRDTLTPTDRKPAWRGASGRPA